MFHVCSRLSESLGRTQSFIDTRTARPQEDTAPGGQTRDAVCIFEMENTEQPVCITTSVCYTHHFVWY